jgi:hypothetical protein
VRTIDTWMVCTAREIVIVMGVKRLDQRVWGGMCTWVMMAQYTHTTATVSTTTMECVIVTMTMMMIMMMMAHVHKMGLG